MPIFALADLMAHDPSWLVSLGYAAAILGCGVVIGRWSVSGQVSGRADRQADWDEFAGGGDL